MMIPLCGYILQGGKRCEQAAIKGELYCRHHLFVRQAIADAAPQGGQHGGRYGERAPLPFVFPEDRAAVQINYFLVLQAVNAGKLDLKTAAMMIRLLKACDANLKKGSLNEGAETAAADSEEQLPAESEQSEEDASETIKIEAAGESSHTRNERSTVPAPQKRAPLDLLRHSRGKSRRGRRRR